MQVSRLLPQSIARYQRWRRHAAVSRSSCCLALMALALLLMPVSYRAGTGQAHPHTVFQAMIDQARGMPHQHGDARGVPAHVHTQGTPLPGTTVFLALNVPLSAYASMVTPEMAIRTLMTPQRVLDHAERFAIPDIPDLTSLQASSELAVALQALMTLLALLLAREPLGRLWFAARSMAGISLRLHSPPPRAFR